MAEVTAFFARCKQGDFVVSELRHKPSSSDLDPFFQKFAAALFEAEADERFSASNAFAQRNDILRGIRKSVVDRITKPNGIWARVVQRSGEQVDMGSWASPFGWFGIRDFKRPRHSILAATAKVLATKRRARLLRERATREPSSESSGDAIAKPIPPEVPTSKVVPRLADWLTRMMRSRRETSGELSKTTGIDPKTIKKILAGQHVSNSVRQKLAMHYSVDFAGVPQS